MKRRNIDVGKPPRRPAKRTNKFTESVYGSSFIYFKFLVVWMFILLADFILEFRFEYIWPLWLLIQSVYDTFKYQGLAYSVFFVCIAITSDTICLLFIPIQWLFFMASTYVWIHYVWHTDKGICIPTVSLWLLFMYVESTIRLRDLKNGPFHVDLCRPFAAHCIGHPVVTLGIGLKSYVTYRLKLRTQHEVQKENNFYYELLKQALPKEIHHNHTLAVTEKNEETVQNNGIISTNKKSSEKSHRPITLDSSIQIAEIPPPSKNVTPSSTNSSSTTPSSTNTSSTTSLFFKKGNSPSAENEGKRKSVSSASKKSENSASNQNKIKSGSGNNSPKSNKNNSRQDHSTNEVEKHKNHIISPPKVEVPHALTNGHILTENNLNSIDLITPPSAVELLESTISKLRDELTSAQKREVEIKNKLELFQSLETSSRNDLNAIKKDNDLLQTRLNNVVNTKQKDRQNIFALEKKLKQESDQRVAAEKQLSEEKRRRKEDEESATRAAATVKSNRDKESAEVLSKAKKDLEEEICKIQHNLSLKDDECNSFKREVQELQLKEKSIKESETLMSALEAMQDKNLMLENSLSAETRLKLDLFSALGDVKRQLELAHVEIYKRDSQIQELKTRMSDILSLLPESRLRSPTPHYSANFLEKPLVHPNSPEYNFNPRTPGPPLVHMDPMMMPPIHLDPNAAMYTPSTSGV